jgi:transcriptional antiterminator NusG
MAERNWYLLHTYSGAEEKARNNLEQKVKTLALADRVFSVVLPVDNKVIIKNGERKVKQEKVYPGYLVVEMIMDDETWNVVTHTPGILGFVGNYGKPIPLSDEEVERIIKNRVSEEEAVAKLHFEVGDTVQIIGGPFDGMQGKVESISPEKEKTRIRLMMFGREMPVEIDFGFIKKI